MDSITSRVARLAQLAPEARDLKPPVPKSAKIELTARCDMECFFCAAHTRSRARSDMPWELYTRIVRELREAGVEQLGLFYYGESFLCDWLPEATRYAKRDCGYPYVFLTTNGLTATADRVRECMLAGLNSLKFSFNCCGPKQFHEVTAASTRGYRTVVNNIKDACWVRDYVEYSTGHRCALYASSLLYDSKQRDRMQGAVDQILPYVDEHYWLPLYGHAGLPASGAGARMAGNTDGSEAPRKSLPCWGLFKEAHITCDGHLSACSLDPDFRFHMGDLYQLSFIEAWHSPKFQALRAAHLRQDVGGTVCERCIAY